MNNNLPYDPGVLPTKPPPQKGEIVQFEVSGYPPYKDKSFSIRNINHKIHDRFMKVRLEGIKTMAKRAWSHTAIEMTFILFAPAFEKGKTLNDYTAGIMDSLDGSSGFTFTYLPIIFEDDSQVCKADSHLIICKDIKYRLKFIFVE